MSTTYDFDSAKAKIPPSIETMENLYKNILPSKAEIAREAGKSVGAQQLIDDIEVMCSLFSSLSELIHSITGDEGDSVSTGSMYGALHYAQKADNILNAGA